MVPRSAANSVVEIVHQLDVGGGVESKLGSGLSLSRSTRLQIRRWCLFDPCYSDPLTCRTLGHPSLGLQTTVLLLLWIFVHVLCQRYIHRFSEWTTESTFLGICVMECAKSLRRPMPENVGFQTKAVHLSSTVHPTFNPPHTSLVGLVGHLCHANAEGLGRIPSHKNYGMT